MAQFEIIALDTGATDQLRAPGSGDSYVANREVAIAVGTLTTNIKAFDVSATWNNAAIPFTGMKFNVTDTASNAASLLADFQVGGVSLAGIRKDSSFFSGPLGSATNTWHFRIGGASGTTGISSQFSLLKFFVSGSELLAIGGGALYANGDIAFGAATQRLSWNNDLFILRDGAANTLAQRNSTNAQTFRVYGTYTDASNYRRAALAMTTAGVTTLKAEGAGTGASGNVLHISTLPTSNPGPGILWNNAGTPAIGT